MTANNTTIKKLYESIKDLNSKSHSLNLELEYNESYDTFVIVHRGFEFYVSTPMEAHNENKIEVSINDVFHFIDKDSFVEMEILEIIESYRNFK